MDQNEMRDKLVKLLNKNSLVDMESFVEDVSIAQTLF